MAVTMVTVVTPMINAAGNESVARDDVGALQVPVLCWSWNALVFDIEPLAN